MTRPIAAGDIVHAGHRNLLITQVDLQTKIWVRDIDGNTGVLAEGTEFTRVGHVTEPLFVNQF